MLDHICLLPKEKTSRMLPLPNPRERYALPSTLLQPMKTHKNSKMVIYMDQGILGRTLELVKIQKPKHQISPPNPLVQTFNNHPLLVEVNMQRTKLGIER